MLGFAIVDRQPKADATAVWLTSREGSRVSHTNAVVIANDDERYDVKIWSLTADRAVVLTHGTTPRRRFDHALSVDEFEGFSGETVEHRQRIEKAISDYATRTKNKNLVIPEFPGSRPALRLDTRDKPQFRALSAANYIAAVWSAWLATDEQRVRRTLNPRTGTTPWIMPEELGNPEIAEFPAAFAKIVHAEPLAGRPTS